MSNYNWMLRIVLPVMVLGGLPLLLHKVVNGEILDMETKLSWANIFQLMAKGTPEPPMDKKPPAPVPTSPGGRRPSSNVCMISPSSSNKTIIVWSDRPLFIWQGKVNKIAVRRQGYTADLWNQTVTSGTESVIYTGKALQPGKTYEWVVNQTMFVPFEVMKAQPRQQIAEELRSLENQLQAKGTDIEGIALAKANYFAQAQLSSDVFQEVYSVPKPSPNLVKIRQELVAKLCN
jgi:hypothetical protein